MTETDVDQLLNRTARRLRLQRALRSALAALGAGLLLAAAIVLWSRLKNYDLLLAVGLTLPPLIALVALFAAYLRSHPPLEQVALLLDQRAGSSEHLVTWYEFRANPSRATTETQREFLDAQRVAMLAKAAEIDPRVLVPVRLPEWSRIVLLAFLLLCCAWLTPPPEAPTHTADETRHRRVQNAGQQGGSSDANNLALDAMPSVEMLSQTDQQKLQLLASDPMLSEARKTAAYKDLQAKLAGIPDSQLTPLDKQLLDQLRPASEKASRTDTKTADSSTTSTGKSNDPKDDSHATSVGAASVPADQAKAFTAIRTRLPADLQLRLESYYRHAVVAEEKSR